MRTEQTASDLKKIAGELAEVVEVLRSIAGRMERERLPCLLLHANTATNKHLRALWDWSRKVDADADVQFRAFEQGRRDRAADRQRNGRRK